MVAVLASTMLVGGVITGVSSASASVKPAPPAVDAVILTAGQLASQLKAASALRVGLMRSGAEVAAANQRLERFSAQANTLLAGRQMARKQHVNPGEALHEPGDDVPTND